MDGLLLPCKDAHSRQTVIQGQGHFTNVTVTAGDTACIVNGVLEVLLSGGNDATYLPRTGVSDSHYIQYNPQL